MGELWATMLPAAVAVALSPTGIVELMLVLLSTRARQNALVFIASVMAGVFLLPLLGASILNAAANNDALVARTNTVTGWVLIGLGVLLIPFAVGSFVKRGNRTPPGIFDEIAAMGSLAVFLLSLSVVWLNPINALVLLSVGSQAAATHVSTLALLPSLVAFTVLATSPFVAVALFVLRGGERVSAALDSTRQRIVEHNRIIMSIALGLLAVVLVAQGIASVSN
ncbi:GAP family protein [Mycolicibacterium sp. ND9-15]|uniref:GAP family protein n=1 Tax=Mycolicibacterium sp. ND9-15 TaxID=3042320 RepID=UPI002DDB2AC8|nr:GAP family protein [Mycolicibacterium sp. ND9-15]WSE57446.1 GAP family protein [Mycolicibacterium sp. ND9-15]